MQHSEHGITTAHSAAPGVLVASSGIPYFSGALIAKMAQDVGMTPDGAAVLVGKLIAEYHRKEGR